MGREEVQNKIKELESELSSTKYNKRTQHHIGLVKAKIAMLKEKDMKGSGGKGGEGYSVKKSGDATVVLLGFPSVGKSTLLNSLTKANSPVGSYAFTTLTVIPGLLEYKHAKIQVLDVPGIVYGAASGRGRGKEVLGVLRNADLILIVVDVLHPEHYQALLKEVYDAGIRINSRKPDVKIKKKAKGGIDIGSTIKLSMNEETIKGILKEMRINNADVVIREDITPDQLVDVVQANKEYVPSISILNKIDLVDEEVLNKLKKEIKPDLMISANKKMYTEELKDMIFNKLKFLRIYLKEVGKKPDLEVPLIMQKGATLKALCTKIHKDFLKKFRFAKIWGPSAKFPGQIFKRLDKELSDEDIVEIHLR